MWHVALIISHRFYAWDFGRCRCGSSQVSPSINKFLLLFLTTQRHWLIAKGPIPTKEAVDDACLVTDGDRSVVILGHNRDNQQLSLINTNNLDNNVSLSDHG